MKTHALRSHLMRVYPRHAIPWLVLRDPSAVQYIRRTFGFREAGLDKPEGGGERLMFEGGYFQTTAEMGLADGGDEGASGAAEELAGLDDDGGPGDEGGVGFNPFFAPIVLAISDTRVEVHAHHLPPTGLLPEGVTTDDLIGAFLGRLSSSLQFILPEADDWLSRPLFELHETTWVGQLDVHAKQVVSPVLQAAAESVATEATTSQISVAAFLDDFSYRVSLRPVEPRLVETGVEVGDREFRFEPRAGFPLDERVWYTESPLPVARHLDLLRGIEDAFRSNPTS